MNTVSGRIGVLFDIVDSFVATSGAIGHKRFADLILAIQEIRITHGYGLGQADDVGAAEYTIAASGTQSIDLSGGFSDAEGNTIVPGRVCTILLYNASESAVVTIKKHATNGWAGRFSGSTDSLAIDPGGVNFWHSPVGRAVVADTGDIEQLTNGSSTAVATVYALILFKSL